ncbi:MAG: CRISPR-associated protein Cas4 [Candidatus Njordarchaeota archaeon]
MEERMGVKRMKKKDLYIYTSPRGIIDENYVTLTDIKNWIYCPKIVYYNRVLRVKPLVGAVQEAGKRIHKEEIARIMRRKGIGKWERKIYILKEKEVELYSQRLRLRGIVDLIVMNEYGEIFPVEIKYMRSNKGRIWLDHRFQLIAQAMLIEENYNRPVKRAYIYYCVEQKVLKTRITKKDKELLEEIIRKILDIIESEEEPKTRVPKSRCTGGCGYAWICKR